MNENICILSPLSLPCVRFLKAPWQEKKKLGYTENLLFGGGVEWECFVGYYFPYSFAYYTVSLQTNNNVIKEKVIW